MMTASEVDGSGVLHRAADTGDEGIVTAVLEALRGRLTHEEVTATSTAIGPHHSRSSGYVHASLQLPSSRSMATAWCSNRDQSRLSRLVGFASRPH